MRWKWPLWLNWLEAESGCLVLRVELRARRRRRKISLNATVPGLNLCGFLSPTVDGMLLLAVLVANCIRIAFPSIDSRAVGLVPVILKLI